MSATSVGAGMFLCPDCGEPLNCGNMMPIFNGDCSKSAAVCDDCYDRINARITAEVNELRMRLHDMWFNIIVDCGGVVHETKGAK